MNHHTEHHRTPERLRTRTQREKSVMINPHDSATTRREEVADALRAWALDEELKARVLSDPGLAAAARRVASRYIGGDTIGEAVAVARAGVASGHLASIEYAGESVRDRDLARSETDVFLELAQAIAEEGLPSSVSLDLSHLGAVVDAGLGLAHARELAAATASSGQEMMISAEGSDRTDLVLGLYETLANEYDHVGITLQARLHRTPRDLERVLRTDGRVRLVKGAFLESEEIALRRGTEELTARYLDLGRVALESGHAVTFATHDDALVEALQREHGDRLRQPGVEFEMLLGLGTELLDGLRADGYRTRQYVVFGGEWWLYVLNRIAEHPERVFTALTDLRS